MPYAYPPHHPDLPYAGRHHYFLTFCTAGQARVFEDSAAVDLVRTQLLRAAGEYGFEITAYCYMPDHVHLLVHGIRDDSDCKAFIKAAKQYSGYYFRQRRASRLWQRYGFERVVRDDRERAYVIGYVVANPVRAGLVSHPQQYAYLGSQVHSVGELLQMCEYGASWV